MVCPPVAIIEDYCVSRISDRITTGDHINSDDKHTDNNDDNYDDGIYELQTTITIT